MSGITQELLIAQTSTGKLTACTAFRGWREAPEIVYRLLVKRSGTVRTIYSRDAAEAALAQLGGVPDRRCGLEE